VGEDRVTTPDSLSWLRQVIAERLELARAAGGGSWTLRGHPSEHVMISSGTGALVWDEGDPSEEEGAHIAANDPRDVIARCEAELGILDLHQPASQPDYPDAPRMWLECRECGPNNSYPEIWAAPGEGEAFYPCGTLVLLAAGYRHHPGYAEAGWEPERG
jgi:uncharacterized protein DUF6221